MICDAVGRDVALAAGEAFEGHDAARGDDVEGEALSEIIGLVEAAILDLGADFEGPEELLGRSAYLAERNGLEGTACTH